MDREYLDEELRRLATDPAFRPPDWTDTDIKQFHRLVQCVRAAHVETDLRNMRLLRLQPHGSGDPRKARADLHSGRVIDLIFQDVSSYGVVVLELATRDTEVST